MLIKYMDDRYSMGHMALFLITMNLLECIPEYAKICHGKHASKERI